MAVVLQPYQLGPEETLRQLKADDKRGLSDGEARRRAREYGPNRLVEAEGISVLATFAKQFQDFMVMVLVGATVISGLLGETADALAILAIIILNAVLGFIQEFKAERSLEALRQLAAPRCIVVRNGRERQVEAVELVPGDIVILSGGDRVPADGRLLESSMLEVEEAALTGESQPVEKKAEFQATGELPLAERRNSVFMGTVVTRGRARYVVTATGMQTEIGKIAEMIQGAPVPPTPLQRRLQQLGQWLVAGCLALVACVVATGVLRGFPTYRMFLTGVSLAVAAIPEGLPAVVTIALAIGVQRMIRCNAIIRRLPAVETLGCATVICSDKTGTLTQNVMTVTEIQLPGGKYTVTGSGYNPMGNFCCHGREVNPQKDPDLLQLLTAVTLCNNSRLYPAGEERGIIQGMWEKVKAAATGNKQAPNWTLVGDPTEGALLAAAAKAGIYREKVEAGVEMLGEIPFDSDRKRMTTLTRSLAGEVISWTKGAPDVILGLCDHVWEKGHIKPLTNRQRREICRQYEDMSERALRVLGVAIKRHPPGNVRRLRQYLPERELERNLIYLGLVGMLDPPRPEARQAIATARRAGIRTVMVTGDHRNTAAAIARELGLLTEKDRAVTGYELDEMDDESLLQVVDEVNVFARVSPHHKLRIVRALKARGQIVGMTGDGVNDAPAVKEADIGIAMGKTGTEVTKEASDMVLADDNFSTIVAAVEEGRAIYDNIRKFIRYLLSCNVGEVLSMFGATLAGLPLPLVPIQILWMNLITDGLPAIALSVDPGDPDLMDRPPRPPQEGVFARGLHIKIVLRGFLIGLCTLALFAVELFWGSQQVSVARTMAFTTLVMAQLFYVFQCRSERHTVFEVGFLRNLWLVGAVTVSTVMHLAVLYMPLLQPIFRTTPLDGRQWITVLLFSGWSLFLDAVLPPVKQVIRRRLVWMRT